MPAGNLPAWAALHGAKVIQINPGATELDNKAFCNIKGNAGEVLPLLLQSLTNFLYSSE
jgi:NAD-dependent SIR2 family protein deacetylase